VIGQPALEIDLSTLADDAIVSDIVYVPLKTPLLAAADERGLIPASSKRDPFHRDYFARRQGALCAVVPTTSSEAQRGIRAKEPGLRWHEMGSYYCSMV